MSDPIQKRAKRRRLITRGLVAAALVLVGAFVIHRVTQKEPPPQYRTAQATRGDIESAIVALGAVEAKNYVDVGAQVSGQLLRLHYDIGEEVQQGELVAEIDPELAQSRVDVNRAQLRELEASRQQQIAQLQLARAKAERNRALLAVDAISQAEVEATDSELAVATARIAQLDAQIDRTQSTLQGDLTSLNYTKIYAPMSGTVVSHSAVEGQTLNANQTAPIIMRIADLNVMTISADVSEADVPRLRASMPAYFTTLGNPDRIWRTTVRQVLPEPEIVNDVVLYKALLDVDNSDRALLPSMTAQVSFVLGETRNAVKIPAAALQLPPAMLIAAGAEPNPAIVMGRGSPQNRAPEGQRGPGAAGEAPRPQGRPQQAAPNDAGSGDDVSPDGLLAEAQPSYVTDANAPPRRQTVLVMKDDKAEPRQVTVGLVSRTEAEVLSGVEPGEIVVLGELALNANGAGFNGPPGGPMMMR